MRFTVPQFIEHEAKIIGPLTFRQFLYIGFATAISFILYFSLAKKNFFLFVLIVIVLFLVASALAFLKIGGRGIPTIIKNFFVFSISPKMFLWRKGSMPMASIKEVKIKKEENKKTPALKAAGESQLNKLSTKVETQTK